MESKLRERGISVESIYKMCLLTLLGGLLAGILKQWKSEYALLTILATILLLFSLGQTNLSKLYHFILLMQNYLGEYQTFLGLLFKILGVAWLCQLCAEMSRDAGFSSLGTQVEFFGKGYILLSGIPIVLEVLGMMKEFK